LSKIDTKDPNTKAVLAPIQTLGTISKVQKEIIFNTLQESISIEFNLESQDQFEKAQEAAFQEMDADQFTEDQCIMLIKEYLQVENFFIFKILSEDAFIQLSLTKIDINGKKDVRNSICNGCNLIQINNKIRDLISKFL